MMAIRPDDRARRLSRVLIALGCLVAATGCGPVEPSEAEVAQGASSALSFGPCRDCFDPEFSDAGQDAPGVDHHVGGIQLRLPPPPILISGQSDAGIHQHLRLIEDGGGPVGMGPCADCLLVSVKLSDLGLQPEDIDDIDKAALIRRDGRGRDLPPIEQTDPPWGFALRGGAEPELWVGIPLDRMKLGALWQIEAVRLTIRLEDGGELETSAPPQRTQVELSDTPPDRPAP